MTNEELLARLRECSSDEAMWSREAADRIEALIAERDALFRRATLAEEWRDHDKTRAETAEAKLAKAVDFAMRAERYAKDTDNKFLAEKARATLAEIKGESHE